MIFRFLNIVFIFYASISIGVCQKNWQKDYDKAKIYFEKGAYYKANQYFDLCEKKYKNNNAWNWLNARCLIQLGQIERAEALLWRLIEKEHSSEYFEAFGSVLIQNKKYARAKEIMLKASEQTDQIKIQLASCDSIKNWKSSKLSVVNLKSLNSSYDEITPTYFNNQLVYSSNQEKSIIMPKSDISGQPFFNIYKAELSGDRWVPKRKFKSTLNTINNDELGLVFSSDSTSIFLTRREPEDSNSNIIVSKLYNYVSTNNKWKEPLVFNYDTPGIRFMHPSPSQSGRLLFFSSDLPGGYGGLDIYFCIQTDGIWSSPINAGPSINTAFDEIYPCYQEGILRFSSNGHPGYGGFDIFESIQVGTSWDIPVNLKAPINSSRNDISFSISDEGVFFSSDRDGGKGGYDLYQIK